MLRNEPDRHTLRAFWMFSVCREEERTVMTLVRIDAVITAVVDSFKKIDLNSVS